MKWSTLFKLSAFALIMSTYSMSYAQDNDTYTKNNNGTNGTKVNGNGNHGSQVVKEPMKINTLTNEVTTETPAADKMTPGPQDDMKITNSIKSQISKSSVLSKLKVNVETHEGVVTFSGNVNSDSEASMLVELAQSIIGVKDVDADNLKVKDSTQPFTDMLITAKVKGLFIRDDVFGTKDIASVNISVETNNGVVYLTGVVDNQDQIKNAIKIAETVKGVKKVEYRVQKVMPAEEKDTTKENGNMMTNGNDEDDSNKTE